MTAALVSLTVSGFLSSTVLPGSSEAAFLAFLLYHPEYSVIIANTAGSMTSFFLMIRFISHKKPSGKALNMVSRFGTPLLFFSICPDSGGYAAISCRLA